MIPAYTTPYAGLGNPLMMMEDPTKHKTDSEQMIAEEAVMDCEPCQRPTAKFSRSTDAKIIYRQQLDGHLKEYEANQQFISRRTTLPYNAMISNFHAAQYPCR